MIFVRCKDGVSHNPAEYTSPEDCAAGAQVLLGAYLRYDDHIRQQHLAKVANANAEAFTEKSVLMAEVKA